jgi:hypothetical protein
LHSRGNNERRTAKTKERVNGVVAIIPIDLPGAELPEASSLVSLQLPLPQILLLPVWIELSV